MRSRQVRRVLVVNRDDRLARIVSLGDLAAQTGHPERVGVLLQSVSEPAMAHA
jgi:hypothetical protein